MQINFNDAAGKTHSVSHDLNFASAKYETKHVITFKNPKAPSAILERLRSSGPVPGDEVNGASGKKRQSEIGASGVPKKKKGDGKGVDMDKLAEGLQKLGEDDLLQVVQMVHDNKNEDSWMRNDVEREYLVRQIYILDSPSENAQLTNTQQKANFTSTYTLSQTSFISMLWGFTKEKGAIEVGA